jgi:hypothetical protein
MKLHLELEILLYNGFQLSLISDVLKLRLEKGGASSQGSSGWLDECQRPWI